MCVIHISKHVLLRLWTFHHTGTILSRADQNGKVHFTFFHIFSLFFAPDIQITDRKQFGEWRSSSACVRGADPQSMMPRNLWGLDALQQSQEKTASARLPQDPRTGRNRGVHIPSGNAFPVWKSKRRTAPLCHRNFSKHIYDRLDIQFKTVDWSIVDPHSISLGMSPNWRWPETNWPNVFPLRECSFGDFGGLCPNSIHNRRAGALPPFFSRQRSWLQKSQGFKTRP